MYVFNELTDTVVGQFTKDGQDYVRIIGQGVIDIETKCVKLPKETLDLAIKNAYNSPFSDAGRLTYMIIRFNESNTSILVANAAGFLTVVNEEQLRVLFGNGQLNINLLVGVTKKTFNSLYPNGLKGKRISYNSKGVYFKR